MLLQSRRTQCGNFGGIYDRSFFKFLPTKEGADEVFQDIMADSAEKLSFAVDEVSTESPEFPAQNLVGNGDNGWCCEKLGVSEAVVIVKLLNPSRISVIKVVNNWTALLEVEAQKASSPPQWETLVARSSFMTPLDSRNKKNGDTERDLVVSPSFQAVVWEKLKFRCQQPFNKNLAYGLKSIEVLPPKSGVNGVPKLGGLQLRKKQPNEDIKPGDLFSSTSNKHLDVDVSDAAAVSDNDIAASPKSIPSVSKDVIEIDSEKEDEAPTTSTKAPVKPPLKRKGSKKGAKNDSKPSTSKTRGRPPKGGTKRKKDLEENGEEPDEDGNDDQVVSRKKSRTGGQSDNLKEIMKGCILAFSGFVNPLRGELRDKALEMGAKYRPDWTTDCTHLVCAFPNTPKFSQVRAAGGRIVKQEWIVQCYENKRMLPWRTFMLKPDRSKDVDDDDLEEMEDAKANEDEEWEPDFEDSSGEEEEDSPDDAVSSDELEEPLSDPDEEVYSPHENELASDEFSSDDDGGKKGRKKVGDKNKKSPKVKPKPSPKRRRRGVKFEDEEETDEEDEDLDLTDSSEPESGNKNFTPRQRPLFRNMHFFLFGDFPDDLEENKLKQVITDLAGTVRDENDEQVTHCVTSQRWSTEFDQACAENPGMVFVQPKWIYDCQECRTLLDARKYKPKADR